MRAIVVGGGIIGAHVAAELVRCGADVTLVDRGEPGSTSEGSFAWIDFSNPDVDYLELRVRGVEAWAQIGAAFDFPPWLSLPGTLTWATDDAGRDRVERHAELLHALGHPATRLTVAQVRRREPDLEAPTGVEEIHHFAGEGWVFVRPAIEALLGRARAGGLEARRGVGVTRLLLEGGGGRVSGVGLDDGGVLRGDVVVCCVGRHSEGLVGGSGVRVPMVAAAPGSPVVGLVVVSTPVRTRLRSVLHADGLSLRPDRGRRLAIHDVAHDARAPVRGPVPALLAEDLLALARRRVRGAEDARVEQARVCLRALTGDGLPVAGRAVDGLYVIATHSGVTLAPALAQLAAAELTTAAEQPLLTPFRPQRFAPTTG